MKHISVILQLDFQFFLHKQSSNFNFWFLSWSMAIVTASALCRELTNLTVKRPSCPFQTLGSSWQKCEAGYLFPLAAPKVF